MTVKEDKIREALTGCIKASPTIAPNLDGIFPEVLPEGFKGDVGAVITRTFIDRKRSKLGLTGVTESRVTISVVGKRKLALRQASDAIETELSSFRGDMNGIIIKSIALVDQDDDFDDQVGMHIISSVYQVIHENEE